jgi:hypothetical protein
MELSAKNFDTRQVGNAAGENTSASYIFGGSPLDRQKR